MPSETESPVDFKLFTSLRLDAMLKRSQENAGFNNGVPTPVYMTTYHRDRILEAAKHFDFESESGLLDDEHKFSNEIIVQSTRIDPESWPMRVKCVLDRDGSILCDFSPVPAVLMEALFPTTLDLPSENEQEDKPPKPFEPSPLTGGALTMGPTDYQPVPPPTTSKKYSPLKATQTILLDSQPTPYSDHLIYKTTHRSHYDSSRSRTFTSRGASGLTPEVLLYNTSGQIMEGSITTPYFFRNGQWVTPPVWEENHGGQRGTTRRYALEKGLCVEEAVPVESLKNGEKVWISSGVQGFRWGHLVSKFTE